MTGDKCWIELPQEARPGEIWGPQHVSKKEMNHMIAMFRACYHPMVEMGLALFGHPDSGTFWEDYCDGKVKLVGFRSFGAEWPSVYSHDGLRLLLTLSLIHI